MGAIRVMLVDDHTLFREGIYQLLSADPRLDVVGVVADAAAAVQRAAELRPDIVVMDIGMRGLSSFDATREIKNSRVETRVLFLSMYDDDDHLRQAVESGASGYILKDTPAPELIAAVCEISRGGSYFSPPMLSHLVNEFRGPTRSGGYTPQFRSETLTARERQVLALLAEGKTVKEVAHDLNLSVKTVEAHKSNLMRKLDIHNRAELVRYALQTKIVAVHRSDGSVHE